MAHGAATIVNAIATGAGAAFGVDLWTKARVKLTGEPNVVKGEIAFDSTESTLLIERAAVKVLQHFKVETQFGAKIQTHSNIPIAHGLKSSSAAANATVLATAAALGKPIDDLTAINLGVDAAFEAKVTITGAFDDAAASYFGGVVVTDNVQRTLIQRATLPSGLSVLFYVPPEKAYTVNSDVNRITTIAPLVKVAHSEAVKGNYWTALSLNGIIYSSILGYDVSVAVDALKAGALAAGLCGKGPAVTAVISDDKADSVKAVLQSHKGEIIPARINHEKAKVVT